MSKSVIVQSLPLCDICKFEDRVETVAKYDGKTDRGPWANMCESHFMTDGVGLGLGRGQELILA